MQTYKTSEIAKLIGVHPNTVRFYEELGLITAPQRLANHYRVYTELHLRQMELVRLALQAEVLQNGLRKKAIEVIRLCAWLDLPAAIQAAQAYEDMLSREIQNAKAAVVAVETQLGSKEAAQGKPLRRREAAAKLDVSVDTLRNWELNGLITIKRQQNGDRVYSAADLARLNIIRTLRCANYSLASILRLMLQLNREQHPLVEQILNTPTAGEDIVSACDQLIVSLQNTRHDARKMQSLLLALQLKLPTLQ